MKKKKRQRKKQLPPAKTVPSSLLSGKPEQVFKRLAQRYKTPKQVQAFLREYLAYNAETEVETQASAWTALNRGVAHCLEAALLAAVLLEHHGYLPLILSFESKDQLDHVLYVFKQNNKWGSIGRSRDHGLHGRTPRFRSVRDLVYSYVDEYVDKTGRITGYQVFDLNEIERNLKINWRTSANNLWALEQYLIDLKHKSLKTSDERYKRAKKRYLAKGAHPSKPYWW